MFRKGKLSAQIRNRGQLVGQQDARRGEYHSSLPRVSNAIVLHKDMCNSDLLAGI